MPRPVTRSRSRVEAATPAPIPVEQKQEPVKKRNRAKTKTNQTKKLKFEPVIFKRQTSNPILNHLRHAYKLETQTPSIDSSILDHIALEGLEGIKFDYLLNLLDSVSPNASYFNCDKSQLYIWTILIRYMQRPSGAAIRAYYYDLKSKKGKQQEATDNSSFFVDKSIKMPSLAWQRISDTELTLYPVQEGDIMGSCSNYQERIDITEKILAIYKKLGSQASFYDINNRFNFDNIYIVADQELRTRAIFPDWTDPNVVITIREYVCLEFIGKTRTYGAVFPNDRILGRYRILLHAKGFITQYQQLVQSHIVHHLKRFGKSNITHLSGTAFNKKGMEDEAGELSVNDNPVIKKNCCHPRRLKYDQDMLKMVYEVIAQRADRNSLDIRRKLKFPKSHVRNHLKNLLNVELVGSYTKKVGDSLFRIYRARHKSSKFETKRKVDNEKLKGVMAKWDEIDLKAKEILGHKRSSFTRGEDSFLILCRIVTLLIEPGLKKLSFCHDKRFIRDLLHEEFVVSHNKTSDACLRRIKYLRHLPQNLMYINELTAELREDDEIIKMIESARGEFYEEDKNILFVRLLHAVLDRLPSLLGLSNISVPSRLISSISNGRSSSSSSAAAALSSSQRTVSTTLATKNSTNSGRLLRSLHRMSSGFEQHANRLASASSSAMLASSRIVIRDYKELRSKYELVSCQLGQSYAPTYEQFGEDSMRNICLVTVAFSLINSLESSRMPPTETTTTATATAATTTTKTDQHDVTTKGKSRKGNSSNNNNKSTEIGPAKSSEFRLLEKFYSNYSEKMIRSVWAKLGRCSLVVRASNTRKSLKLNQGVLISLNRHQSSSLMQLAHSIKADKCQDDASARAASTDVCQDDDVGVVYDEFSESNDVSSIAQLTSLFTNCSFKLDLKLPANVIDFDEALSDPMIVQPCKTRFTLNDQTTTTPTAADSLKASLDDFLKVSQQTRGTSSRKMPSTPRSGGGGEGGGGGCSSDPAFRSKWLVKGYKLIGLSEKGAEEGGKGERSADLEPVEFEARVWKSIDGSIHTKTLLKLIESILSWVIVFPGLEFQMLSREFCHLMPREHLIELIELMERLKLIKSQRLLANKDSKVNQPVMREARLFGYADVERSEFADQELNFTTYEPQPSGYYQFCRLIGLFNQLINE